MGVAIARELHADFQGEQALDPASEVKEFRRASDSINSHATLLNATTSASTPNYLLVSRKLPY